MNENNQDNEIRARLADNDPSALDMIWNAHASDLFGYLISLLRSRADAEDSLQEVFVTIARRRSKVSKARRLKPYLFQLARNIALNRIKKTRRQIAREQVALDWLTTEPLLDSVDDRTSRLKKALENLPDEQRATVTLKFYQGKTFEEIATITGVSLNTAASRYRYAMAKLKYALENRNE